MHKEILTKEQIELLPLVKKFNKDFGLVGGTAIAFHIGHRQSIDFDLFSLKEFENAKIKKKINASGHKIGKVYRDETGQFTFIMNNVQFTFYHYPYKIFFNNNFANIIKTPDLLTLAAMKAFELGQSTKWKDYVDLYFIMSNFYSMKEIEKREEKIFKNEFNAKLFRMQLSYFDDISYAQKITYLPGFEVDEDTVKKSLIEFSLK
ncbi:nucleotidyl transferase AbiEii/AbiGii toxin family protein [Candidatus Parcubacteria bacterium]|nr:nucleotidyl transferase AbiEii/AbiGii toxin family protein [Candidatus Parcubacteria bacterium]